MDPGHLYRKQYAEQQKKALDTLIDWANGSIAQLAGCAGYTVAGGMRWQKNGRVSVQGAKRLAEFPGCPLTREQMRPDIKIWE